MSSTLVNMTVERMVDLFNEKDNNAAYSYGREVSTDKILSLRKILSELCINGYINMSSLQENSNNVVEEICTLFLPLEKNSISNSWHYTGNDPIAFEALLRYIHDSDQHLR
jgi:hypothetical protein